MPASCSLRVLTPSQCCTGTLDLGSKWTQQHCTAPGLCNCTQRTVQPARTSSSCRCCAHLCIHVPVSACVCAAAVPALSTCPHSRVLLQQQLLQSSVAQYLEDSGDGRSLWWCKGRGDGATRGPECTGAGEADTQAGAGGCGSLGGWLVAGDGGGGLALDSCCGCPMKDGPYALIFLKCHSWMFNTRLPTHKSVPVAANNATLHCHNTQVCCRFYHQQQHNNPPLNKTNRA